ncbi:MAG TPA: hypothetical protein VD993_16940 [Chitinophagaceae bacterium]|nr:hypothetical protein [Chitinophagaceae bacterium]
MTNFMLRFRKHLKMTLFIIFLFVVIAIVIAIALYFSNFNSELSKESEHWSHFGEYLNGTIGILLSFLTFVLLIGLHYHSQNEDHHRWITQIRIEGFRDIKLKLNSINANNCGDVPFLSLTTEEIRQLHLNHYFHLEPKRESKVKELSNRLDDSLAQLISASTEWNLDKSDLSKLPAIVAAFQIFSEKRSQLLDYLHDIIMKKV